jgi:phage terminase large subunit GpA-like protein
MSLPHSQQPFATLASEIVAPAPVRTPDEWANEHRILPPGSAEKGRIRTGRTPYVIPIARAFDLWWVRFVSFCMGRQMAKTHGVIFNVKGRKLEDRPEPILYVGPTRDNIDDVIEPKFDDMLRKTESLWRRTVKGQKYKKHVKLVNGVAVRFAWAGSDTMLKADSAGLVFLDEIDGIESERPIAGEGTVKDMAEAIVSSYADGRVGVTSTPTHGFVESGRHPLTGLDHWQISDELVSAVWRYWQEGTRHEWSWPCPSCRCYFIPKSKHLRPLPEEDLTPEEFEDQGHIQCPNCKAEIKSDQKPWMNARGVMVMPGQKPLDYDDSWGRMTEDRGGEGDGPLVLDYEQGNTTSSTAIRLRWGDTLYRGRPSNVSFWASGLCSFSSRNNYGLIARKVMEATRSLLPQRIQGAYNTLLGECYLAKGDTPPWSEVKRLGELADYSLGQVPRPVTTLVAAVDVSDDELQWSVYGFVPDSDFECFLVHRGIYYGDTDQDDVWELLEKRVLNTHFDALGISVMVIDAGHRPEKVYEFCKRNMDRCIAARGEKTMDSFWKVSKPETDKRGKAKRFGLKLWRLNTDITKSWVHSRVKHSIHKEIIWHLPKDIDDEFCKQITAESRLIDPRGQAYWHKHRANHFLDCAAMAWFGANQVEIKPQRPSAKQASKRITSASREGQKDGTVIVADDPYLQ